MVARADFAAAAGTGFVTVLNSATGEVVKEIKMPASELSGIVLSNDGKRAVVTESASNTVFEVLL